MRFDELMREQRHTDALRLFARQYYEGGKIGHTRMLLMVRMADENDRLKVENAKLKKVVDAALEVYDDFMGAELYSMIPLKKALERELESIKWQKKQRICCEYCKHMVPSEIMNRLYCSYHSDGEIQCETFKDDYCSYFEREAVE